MTSLRRILISFCVLILCLLAIAGIAEVALQWRSRLALPTVENVAKPGDFKVLMIGDSVLGFLDRDPRGLAGRVKASAPVGFAISEISEPALLTKPLAQKAAAIANALRPQLVVLMVGKSDYDAALAEPPERFQELRTVRLLRYVWGDLNLRYKRWTSAEQLRTPRRRRLDAAWAAYGKKDCEAAIPLFAELLIERHDSPTDEPNGRAIYDCYLRTKSFAEGAKFFSELAANAKDGSTFRMYSGTLKLQESSDKPALRASAHAELEQSFAEGDARSIFKTRLWLAKTDRDSAAFARILRSMKVADSAVIDARTIENIGSVIRAFVDQGSQVLILQYPTDHGDVWKNKFTGFGEAVSFVELRQWLLALPENEVAAAVDEDIEHLTDLGADKLAPRLLFEITQKRK